MHKPATWILGQRPAADPADPLRYLVRVTAPASWRKEMSVPVIDIITGVLAETERASGRDPERVRREPDVVVLVEGVFESSIGIHLKSMGSMDLVELATRPYRDAMMDRIAGSG